jgi:undecaprenyl-diphosphatase
MHIDQHAFLFLNGFHWDFLDPLMYAATRMLTWLPLFVLLFYLTLRTYRWKTATVILTLALTITLSDQGSNIAKSTFQRLRPSNDPVLAEKVHIVNSYRGGQFGFYSAHASNTMAVAIFLILLLKSSYCWLAAVMLPWALLMSYTRIYLGVHYPGDILAGLLAGGIIGWIGAQICGYLLSLQTQKS